MYLLPRINTIYGNQFRIKENDPWLKPGERIEDLSKLPLAADRVLNKLKTQVRASKTKL